MEDTALTPLTLAEQEFAAQQHNLIFSYLDKNDLEIGEFYDVAVFGFLKAVKRYLSAPKLQRYAFSTVAWKSMKSSINLELRTNGMQKRNASIISLDEPLPAKDELTVISQLAIQNDEMLVFETELLLHDLAQRLSKKQMAIIRMRIHGHSLRTIAKAQKTTYPKVSAALADLFDVVMEVCYGSPPGLE